MYMYDVLKIRAIWLAEISRDGNPRLQKKKSRPGGISEAAVTAVNRMQDQDSFKGNLW